MNKEKLLNISELNLSGEICETDETFLTLVAFTEDIPAHENRLKESFAAGDNDSLSKGLALLKDSLIKIHAVNLEQSCAKLAEEIGTLSREIAESNLNCFLTAVSSLSIDIQMAAYSADEAPRELSESKPESGEAVRQILAVDDSPIMLNWVKSALQDSPYKFTGLRSGAMALKFIEKNRPDLFILDIEMPEMDGYELARRVRENGQTAPIIFLTGNASKEYVIKAIQAGADDFIVKPINIENMLYKIGKYIG